MQFKLRHHYILFSALVFADIQENRQDCPIFIFKRPSNNSVYSRQFDDYIQFQLHIMTRPVDESIIETLSRISVLWNGVEISLKNLPNMTRSPLNMKPPAHGWILSWTLLTRDDVDDGSHVLEVAPNDSRATCSSPAARVFFTVADSVLRILDVSSSSAPRCGSPSPLLSISFRVYGAQPAALAGRLVEVRCDGQLRNSTALRPCAARCLVEAASCAAEARISIHIFDETGGGNGGSLVENG